MSAPAAKSPFSNAWPRRARFAVTSLYQPNLVVISHGYSLFSAQFLISFSAVPRLQLGAEAPSGKWSLHIEKRLEDIHLIWPNPEPLEPRVVRRRTKECNFKQNKDGERLAFHPLNHNRRVHLAATDLQKALHLFSDNFMIKNWFWSRFQLNGPPEEMSCRRKNTSRRDFTTWRPIHHSY